MASQLVIPEDTVDDILYFSRTADIEALQSTLNDISKELAVPPHDILAAAINSDSGNNALHMAVANGHSEVMKFLLSLSSEPGVSDTSPSAPPSLLSLANLRGNTPLHWAALNGHLEAVKYLVGAGADVAVKNAAGHNAAFEAEQAGKDEAASWLLSKSNEKEGESSVQEKEELETGEGDTNENQKSTGDNTELDGNTT